MPAALREATYARRLRDELSRVWGPRCCYFKIHGGPYQTAGIPDILLCFDGVFLGIELKRPGGRLTPLQNVTLQRIRAAGGEGLVITTDTPVDEAIRRIHDARNAVMPALWCRIHRESR